MTRSYSVGGPGETFSNQLSLQGHSLLHGDLKEVLGQSGLALLVHHDNELDH